MSIYIFLVIFLVASLIVCIFFGILINCIDISSVCVYAVNLVWALQVLFEAAFVIRSTFLLPNQVTSSLFELLFEFFLLSVCSCVSAFCSLCSICFDDNILNLDINFIYNHNCSHCHHHYQDLSVEIYHLKMH